MDSWQVAKRYQAGANLVLLDPDVRKAFRDERAVNDALRLVIELRKVGVGEPANLTVPPRSMRIPPALHTPPSFRSGGSRVEKFLHAVDGCLNIFGILDER